MVAAATAAPLVSVIIPVYQGERLILGAVQSVLRQTYPSIELWVVDDGSTDATLERLTAVEDRRLHVLHQANAGTGAARNAALARARGSYVAFLDSDDRWFPKKIETELATLQHAPEPIALAYSSHYAVDDGGRLLHAGPVRRHSGGALDLLIDSDNFLIPSLCLFDRRIFDTVGAFNPRSYHEDYEFILRVMRKFPIYPTGQRLAVYRQTTGGKCRSILSDFHAARDAELFVAAELKPYLSADESTRLRDKLLRSLYVRFLMYGFDDHARRLNENHNLAGFRGGVKARLGWLFARTGLNLIEPARITVQRFHRAASQRWWRHYLRRARLDLRYE